MPDLTLTREHDEAGAEAVLLRLRDYNIAYTGAPDYTPLSLFLRDESGAPVGGLLGDMYFGWLFVRILWVAEEHRGGGHGERLVRAAEEEARARGCRGMWLDTFSFQAPGFYRRLGFQEFARLDEYPPGHSRHFLWKPL
jgi:GNAT superfamily N-acetyltransferase